MKYTYQLFLLIFVILISSCSVFTDDCKVNGKTYSDGDAVNDGCNNCKCDDGRLVLCTINDCIEIQEP